jgi:hypothetical protein
MKISTIIFLTLVLFILSTNVYAQLERKVDDFTNEVIIRTPVTKKAVITKIISKDREDIYYLHLFVMGKTIGSVGKGVYVMFDDGTKWIREEEEIKFDSYTDGTSVYRCIVSLSPEDLQTLADKKIAKFKLFIFVYEMKNNEAKKLNENAVLIKSAK